MIVGIGIDVVDVERFAETLQRTPALRERILRPPSALCRSRRWPLGSPQRRLWRRLSGHPEGCNGMTVKW